MKIEYKFVTGEKVSIEVYGKFEEIILELDNNLKNNERKETRRHESLSLFDKDIKNMDLSADPFEEVLKNLTKDKLYAAIQKLKPQEQELLHILYICKKSISQEEYAKQLQVSPFTIRKRTQRIRQKLLKLMK